MKITQFGRDLQIMNEWLNLANEDAVQVDNLDESSEIPEPGDVVRTKKMQMDGKVEKLGQNRAGYDEVYFRIADGRLMKTPLSNVIVVQKLADEDHQVPEDEADSIDDEIFSKYKEEKKTTKEGSMGGINRCAPAVDVSYQKVLDKNPNTAHSRVVGEDVILTDILEKWESQQTLEANDFTKILQKQHKPEKKMDEKDYHGWKIRYELKPAKPGDGYRWMAWHSKKGPDSSHKGSAPTAEQAYQDATAWINAGAGVKEKLTKNAIIDFNVEFSRDYAESGEPFYANIMDGHLLFSLEPKKGLKKSSVRAAGTFKFQCISITPEEGAGLIPNGRYSLGIGQDFGDDVTMFPLQFEGTSVHSGDKYRMGEPGLTVATKRD